MTYNRTYRRGALCLMFCLMTACTTIPKADLNVYVKSFNAARLASEAVLTDYQTIRREKAANDAIVEARAKPRTSPIPMAFDPKAVRDADQEDNNLSSRLQALETIGHYNDAFVALAKGKSIQEVQGSFKALGDSVTTLLSAFGTAFPILTLASPLVQNFLQLIETARTREAFAEALKGGEPIVMKIIDEVFVPDTVDFYALRRSLAELDWRLTRRAGLDTARTATRLAAEHIEPVPGSSLEASKQVTQQTLQAALEVLNLTTTQVTINGVKRNLSDLTGLPLSATGPVYTELVQIRLDQLVTATQEAANKYQNIIINILTYRDLLSDYVRMLDQTKATLANARVKLDAPPDIAAIARSLAVAAIQLKRDIEAFHTNRQ
jgi:hypothetical protein